MPRVTAPRAIPSTPLKTMNIEKFLGIDLTHYDTQTDPRRSPDARNMQPDLNGFPVKRKGYEKRGKLGGRVNGAYSLITGGKETRLIHAGGALYRWQEDAAPECLYTGMADEKSRAVQIEDKLMIADGKRLLCCADFDGTGAYTLRPADECGTTPLISIGRKPDGSAAQSYDPYNLFTAQVEEDFLADGKTLKYVLSYPIAADGEIKAEQRDKDGEWQPITDFTADRAGGIITFKAAPPLPAAAGEDNIRIVYPHKRSETALKALEGLNSCRALCAYGVEGQPDRLVCGAETVQQNRVWYSQFRDPLYIGDVWYLLAGQARAPVAGFGVLGKQLVIYKRDEDHQRNVYIVESGLDDDGDARYPVSEVLQGEGALALGAQASLGGEPLYLSKRGVLAVTTADATAQHYLQERSFYVSGRLTREKGLENAEAAAWDRFYLLALNEQIYLLDSAQKSYEKDSPHSTYQYECYLWDGIPARRMWVWDGALWFGAADGGIYRFCTGDSASSYMDDGRAVSAYWTTPLMNLGSWTNLKTVTDVWAVIQPYARSGAAVYYATDKEYWTLARDFNMDIFDWDDIDFDRFTFNTMDRPQITALRRKAKKVKLFQVRVKNAREREPFGLCAVCIRYRTGGKIKR